MASIMIPSLELLCHIYGVSAEKMHNLAVESYVLFGGQNWGLKPRTQPLRQLQGTDLKR